ncbi:helix-turn-helix domain-containing protein [Levilactobacillus enshiensis]|uniref:helix-turn-helix domain-containing protein n=1 Tax=Levilactobacillus enshiensis TaxID=2590213 RepID=UPI00117B4507|nr:helix-turn-helix domain-containing protein [Levilactobacillus enshiensis]
MDSNAGLGLGLVLPDSELKRMRNVMYEMATDAYKQAGKGQQFGEYLNKSEAAKYLHVSNATLTQFISEGLPIIVIGNIQRISKKACDEFYQQHQL